MAEPYSWSSVGAAAAAAAAAAAGLWFAAVDPAGPAACSERHAGDDELTEDEQRMIKLFTSATKSVVFVTNEVALQGRRGMRFSGEQQLAAQGSGSGFVYDDRGHIVTNCHVIKGASAIKITNADQQTFECTVVGKDKARDIAVIKATDPGAAVALPPLPTAPSSARLMVGQKALAIGNPFGLDHTLTTGVVSALGREIPLHPESRPLSNMIQTDAAMNPGSSGGPLLNSAGKAIGMNTVIYSSSGSSAGVGFAIPIDTVRAVANQLIRHGRPVQPGIGVSLLPDAYTQRFGIAGAVIATAETHEAKRQFRETSRDRRGQVVLGDIITRINEIEVKTTTDVYRAFEDVEVGDTVEVEYDRLTGHRRGRAMEVEQHTTRMRAVDINGQPRSRL